jgi:hypothetical protein
MYGEAVIRQPVILGGFLQCLRVVVLLHHGLRVASLGSGRLQSQLSLQGAEMKRGF